MSKSIGLFLAAMLFSILIAGQESAQQDTVSVKRIQSLVAQGYYSKARIALLKMPQEFKSGAQAAELTGDIFGGLKQWDSAMMYYERFKKMDPKNAAGHFKYGGALGMKALEKNKLSALMYLDDIEAHFQKAVEVDPTYVAAHWALIEYYLQVPGFMGGGVDRAMEQSDKLFGVSPVDGWMARARIAEKDEDLQKAEQYYDKALREGQSLWTYRGIISFYERQNRWDSAFDKLNKAMTQFQDLSLNYQWAKMSVLSGKHVEQGLTYIRQCIEPQAKVEGIPEQWIRLRYAQLLRKDGQNKAALAQVNRALALEADFAQALQEQKDLKKLLN